MAIAMRRKWNRTNRSSGAHARRENELGIENRVGQLSVVQVRFVFPVLRVAVVALLDDRIEQIGEDVVGFFVAGDRACYR